MCARVGEVFLLKWKVKAWMDGAIEMKIERAEGRKDVEEVIILDKFVDIDFFCFDLRWMCVAV